MRAVIRITVKKHIGYTETIPFSRLADVAPEIHSFYKFPFLEQLPVREHFSIEL